MLTRMKLQYLDLHIQPRALSTKNTPPSLVPIVSRLQRLGNALLHWLTTTEDIQVRQINCSGEIQWLAIDRATHTAVVRTSEAEIREYLERRYYQ